MELIDETDRILINGIKMKDLQLMQAHSLPESSPFGFALVSLVEAHSEEVESLRVLIRNLEGKLDQAPTQGLRDESTPLESQADLPPLGVQLKAPKRPSMIREALLDYVSKGEGEDDPDMPLDVPTERCSSKTHSIEAGSHQPMTSDTPQEDRPDELGYLDDGGNDLSPVEEAWMRFVEEIPLLASQAWVAPRENWKKSYLYVKMHLRDVDVTNRQTVAQGRGTVVNRGSLVSMGRSFWLHSLQNLMKISLPSLAECVLKPNSMKRLAWTLIGVLLIFFDAVTVPLLAFDSMDHSRFELLNWFAQIYWTLDIGICFITGVYVKSELVLKLRDIARVYMRTWFGIDIVVTLPLWVVVLFSFDSGGNSTSSFRLAKFLRAIRFIRLVRIIKIDKLLNESLDSVNSSAFLLAAGVLKLICALAFVCHITACFFYLVGSSREGDRRGWNQSPNVSGASTLYQYLCAAHWAVTQFQGTSDILPGSTLAERGFAVGAVLIALVLLASFVSSLTNMIMKFQSHKAKMNHRNEVVRGYLHTNHVSQDLALHIKKYIAWKQCLDDQKEFDLEMPTILPKSLWTDVLHNVRVPALKTYGFFFAIHDTFPRIMRRVCFEAMELLWPHPGEVLFSFNDEGSRMYFITFGEVEYIWSSLRTKTIHSALSSEPSYRNRSSRDRTSEQSRSHCMERIQIERGMYLSEGSLWASWVHLGECAAHDTLHSSAKVLVLKAIDFMDIMLTCRPAHACGVRHAQRFCAMFNGYGRSYSDFIDPAVVEDLGDPLFDTDEDDE